MCLDVCLLKQYPGCMHLLKMMATSVEHAAMMLHVGRGKESSLGKAPKEGNGCS